MRRFGVVLLMGMLVGGLLVACGGENKPDNSRLIEAFAEGRTGVWVSGHGTVAQVFPVSGEDQRMLVRVDEGFSVLLRHRIGSSGPVPVSRGDLVAFHGRYEFHGGGGEMLLTHADPAQPGGGGWVIHQGQRYQ